MLGTIIMMAAEAKAPNRCQAISDHHTDSTILNIWIVIIFMVLCIITHQISDWYLKYLNS